MQTTLSKGNRSIINKKKTLSYSSTNKIKSSNPTNKIEQDHQRISMESQKIYEFIEQLQIKQKQCEKNGKYVEAESYKRKVKVYREEGQKKQMQQIQQRHINEREQIQKAHCEQLNCFNIEWNQIILQFNQQVQQMEEQIINKHQQKIKLIEDEQTNQKLMKFRESPQLLNLKKIQQELAKQQNYIEAHHVQQQAQKLEKEQLQKWKKNQQHRDKNSLEVLKQKQQAELRALQQRIQLGFEEKERQKQNQIQKLLQKLENVLSQLQYQQKQEIARFQKANKLNQINNKHKGMIQSSISHMSIQ